ncbi:hypothetical protein U9M48_007318 [Paspalum notatum var. saurae]
MHVGFFFGGNNSTRERPSGGCSRRHEEKVPTSVVVPDYTPRSALVPGSDNGGSGDENGETPALSFFVFFFFLNVRK